jgi:hypothetical protein
MAQQCKAAMVAMVGLGHLLDNFEDSRRLSSLSPRFHRVPVDGWMWRPTTVEAIYRETPRSKGARTATKMGLAGPPGLTGPGVFWPISGPSFAGGLLLQL